MFDSSRQKYMKGTRRKYVNHVVRKLIKLCNDLEFYLLLPDAESKIEETFFNLKKIIERIHNQTKSND